MKKLFSFLAVSIFAIAVCNAVPYSSDASPGKTELSKKYFELQAFDVPVVIEVPAAPVVVYDLIVPEVEGIEKEVSPHSNSPPQRKPALNSYSMAFS